MAKTLAELGRLAGCSAATVSRALNNSHLVNPKTRELILQAAGQSRYAGKLRVRKPPAEAGVKSVDVIYHRHNPMERVSVHDGGMSVEPLAPAPDDRVLSAAYRLSTSFHRHILDGILAELAVWNCKAVVQINHDFTQREFLDEQKQSAAQGVLVLGEMPVGFEVFLRACQRPLVLVDILHDRGPDMVSTDNFSGVTVAMDHLLSLGHRRIGYVGRLDSIFAFKERFTAYQWKMAQAELPVNPSWVYSGPDHIDPTAKGVRDMLRHAERPTAFMCGNDCYAMGVLRAAADAGLLVPRDLSLVGFDDIEPASLVTPALSTVRVPMAELGRRSVQQLMIKILKPQSTSAAGCQVRLRPELVLRQSTQACA